MQNSGMEILSIKNSIKWKSENNKKKAWNDSKMRNSVEELFQDFPLVVKSE